MAEQRPAGRLGLGPFRPLFGLGSWRRGRDPTRRRDPTAPARPKFLVCVQPGELYAELELCSRVSAAKFLICVHMVELYAKLELWVGPGDVSA